MKQNECAIDDDAMSKILYSVLSWGNGLVQVEGLAIASSE